MKKHLTSLITIIFLLLLSTASVAVAQGPTTEASDGSAAASTEEATAEPTEEATAEPTEEATAEPTEEATAEPTEEATAGPTEEATAGPTEEATAEPIEEATAEPTDTPTAEPTDTPTDTPTAEPTDTPTAEPTDTPTAEPTDAPTAEPTDAPTDEVEITSDLEELATSDSASAQSFSTSITFYTPSTTGGTLQISLYEKDSNTPVPLSSQPLSPHAAGSVFIGTQSGVSSNFLGSAVLQSDVQVIATGVQVPQSGDKKYPRPLYSGFSGSDISDTVYVATFLKNQFNSSSRLAIQNTESSSSPDAQVTVSFYRVGETTATYAPTVPVKGQSMVYFDADDISQLGTNFNGSVVISSQGGEKLAATVQENGLNNREAYAFEGVAQGAQKVYMPSMICDAFGGQTSFYAIQNTDLNNKTDVNIDFYDKNGNSVGNMSNTEVVGGGKLSVNPCDFGVPAGTSGSAVVNSTATDIIAIGKVKKSGGFATAFLGQAVGSRKVAAPYIRWAKTPDSNQRSFIAIMNVGATDAQDVEVKYYDASGSLQATHSVATSSNPLKPLIKVNSDANTAGALDANNEFGISPFGGAIEVESDQDIVVVVRSQQSFDVGTLAEDYNGVPFN